ncbi:deoxyguanosinetriphosphate triphosphohydrolase [Parvularcula sp. ZS-1/3]|uniref:Deoxyguanosinetriphosphate triphosphohydrolase-like protein n=1 Tax=Parvularcula mediterranea TaxID=2732508 RepID=A0A7Y3RLK4_9PROT|nr:deoxyguanosinetriphosphate triphosphohydrolase [Parvularcula mediterranea]NNU16318.1 deoxyguanosinetriphosphate triphosphohydrolase [Parvularcula mediterranea]
MPLAFPAPLAPYASKAEETRGRLHEEIESTGRTPFQRDRDRVLHTVAFRRLKHKTQVFVFNEGDHYRTRLTHSLEVSQIARAMARTFKLDEDLAEVVALSHDLGHPCFGHTGEDVLIEMMEGAGGFDHNAQTLRLLTKLERQHGAYHGLNLTWETLEGTVKHNGPMVGPRRVKDKPLPVAIEEYAERHDLWLDTYPSFEAQLAALADDVAYNSADSDDGLRAGLFSFDDAMDVPLLGPALHGSRKAWPDEPREVQIAEAVSALIGRMVADIQEETRARIEDLDPRHADDIRRAPRAMASFSDSFDAELKELRAFLFEHMYRHHKVNQVRSQARRIVRDLFELYVEEPDVLPPAWFDRQDGESIEKRKRVVCDYIAGMTDRFAIHEHSRLFDLSRNFL